MPRDSSFFLIAMLLLSIASCTKEKLTGRLSLRPHYHVDGQELVLDTVMYQNAVGNPYSINKLRYFLSDFRFVKNDNSEVSVDGGAFFFDAREENTITLQEVPSGSFSKLRFSFGIPSNINTYGDLPNTPENVGMVWPEQMGGGYHFLKFEGYFNSLSGTDGYAIHVGNNVCLAKISINTPFDVDADGDMIIGFNLNEIMTGPNTFDLDSSNYTMGIMPAMLDISENMQNAFTLEQAP